MVFSVHSGAGGVHRGSLSGQRDRYACIHRCKQTQVYMYNIYIIYTYTDSYTICPHVGALFVELISEIKCCIGQGLCKTRLAGGLRQLSQVEDHTPG